MCILFIEYSIIIGEIELKISNGGTILVKSKWWWEMDSNHRRCNQQIYSLPPLAARESHRQEKKILVQMVQV